MKIFQSITFLNSSSSASLFDKKQNCDVFWNKKQKKKKKAGTISRKKSRRGTFYVKYESLRSDNCFTKKLGNKTRLPKYCPSSGDAELNFFSNLVFLLIIRFIRSYSLYLFYVYNWPFFLQWAIESAIVIFRTNLLVCVERK